MKNRFLLAIFVSLTFAACKNNDVFFQYKAVNAKGWNKDSLYTFDIQITDTTSTYNVYVNVRNRGEYPYQNLWLFLDKTSPDKVEMKDSIECYLADQRGKWLGSGIGSVMEMPILYQENVRFTKSGIYRYKIVHGMRDTTLTGINDIGMRIEKIVK
ncbi:gliding motility-associated lipoprotein GldH [Paludibacter propionicigenes WB4]|uniref:Gliding motility-associated lipoprotein GldH n=1 Tax=Paludibacter propionicigenes (strain DSM 17365 / JCM 13257 / WB4) TaxID=694427 RepID=E4T745_PALPW|nr:gliding motility lipoprotein GldH [Paludibacter propionicigenes]ADQ80539.1 gliding motility-associated lipoprotein GldH [Paludibacter propionicigenes WB4]